MSFGADMPANAPLSTTVIRLWRKSILSNVGCEANASDLIIPAIEKLVYQNQLQPFRSEDERRKKIIIDLTNAVIGK